MPTNNADERVGADPHELYPADLATLDRAVLERVVQRRAQPVYLGNGLILSRVLTRYKILLHAADRGFGGHVMMDGFWEIWLNQFVARTLRPGMTVIDAGANYGYYTLLFADIVTRSGRVLAVEPNPAAAELLRQSVRLNGFEGHVQVVESALGATTDGSARLVVPEHEPKNAHLSPHGPPGAAQHSVPLTTLDHLTAPLDRVDFIKIDAEGSEAAIIAGMHALLQKHAPSLVLEFNTGRSAEPGALLDQLLAVYGSVATVGYDGNPVPTDRETVLTTQRGEDWMLYFARPGG